MGTKNYRNHAFTLVELLITLSIVVILAAVAMMYLRGQTLKGNDARRKADIERIKVAVEEYEKDHNCYPQYVNCGVKQSQPIYPYLNNVPCDPTTGASYIYDYPDGLCPGWYRFYSKLEFIKDTAATPGIGPSGAFNYVSGSANAPNSTPSSGGGVPSSTSVPASGGTVKGDYYGCRSGACVPINWNPARPGPECDPSFQNSSCYGQCGLPILECVTVN
jgi:prepilin-type N-terminal cleavage/methylation domain-containing protein